MGRAQTRRRNRFDRCVLDVDQIDVVAIERLVIVGVDRRTLRAVRMILRAQQFCGFGILDRFPDLVANELRDIFVGCSIGHDVFEAGPQ